jgi:hypothetical protein
MMNNPGVLTHPEDCSSLWNCFKFSISYGRSGDFGDAMYQKLNSQWWFAFAFDVAVRFVLLNVCQGITVDTFSELREEKLERLKDTFETCFICGIDKQMFDRNKESKGFKVHIKKEHNMWNYLYFIIYIWEQDKDDDDGLEQYVRRSIDADDISWLPANKAMCLNIVDDDAEAETREHFGNDLHAMESSFVNRLTQFQTDVSAAVMKIRQALDKRNETEVTTVQSFEDPGPSQMILRPMSVPSKSISRSLSGPRTLERGLKKASTMSLLDRMDRNGGATLLIVEVGEITGLNFASRTLDSIVCVVRSDLGSDEISSSHVMIQDQSTLVLFEPTDCLVSDDYSATTGNEVVVVQIAYGSPCRYMGKVLFTMSELGAESQQRLEKSFVAEVMGTTSKGTLVINTSKKDAFLYENL